MKHAVLPFFITAFLSFTAIPSHAQEVEVGKTDFRLRCAACHGPTGTGDGMIGQMLKVPPPDLTRLAERNGGAFPFKKVYDIIDGRTAIGAHGTRDMPIWGDNYRAEHLPSGQLPDNATERQVDAPERSVEAHILAIVYYLGTIQWQK